MALVAGNQGRGKAVSIRAAETSSLGKGIGPGATFGKIFEGFRVEMK